MKLIEKRISAPTGEINVAISGEERSPLLMLHGVTRRWQSFLTLGSALSFDHQLHAMDFRGHGRSDRTPGHYRVIDYAEEAIHYLDHHVQKPAVVYGHSLGAMVAAIVAAERTDRVAAVILEDPPFHTMGNAIGNSVLLSLFQAFQRLAGDGRTVTAVATDLAEANLQNPQTGEIFRLGDLRDAASMRFTAACLKQLDPDVLKPIVAGEWLEGFDVQAVMRRIECPVLLLQAEVASEGMLVDEDVADLKLWTQDLVHVQFPGCGHLIHWSRTNELLNAVHAFLGALELNS